MIWAFAREGAFPCHNYFRVISPSTKTPRRTVWLSVGVAFILGTPLLKVRGARACSSQHAAMLPPDSHLKCKQHHGD